MTREQFKEIFEKYHPGLCLFAESFVTDSLVASDMVQEAIIELWKKRLTFNNEKAIKSFLYTVTRNNCLNHLKHSRVKQAYNSQVLESEVFFRDQIIEQETYQLIHAAIGELPKQGKRIIKLSLAGLKNPEIALRLDISVNTVKSVKANAIKLLRVHLKKRSLFLLLILVFSLL
ncbi:RNA polymerase sigma-70 factor [Marinilabiliaceae bacterium JC017]|nr:RNA polymerase sigma-70 factor [Marinilabiliaceae bacterium JC017]